MKIMAMLLLAATMAFQTAGAGEIKTTAAVAVQMTKKSAPGDNAPLADSWVRAEPKIAGTSDKGVSGLVHLRFEPKMGSSSSVAAQARQLYFQLPASIVTVQVGRWYEIYTPGSYFGRYLCETNDSIGYGSMCTNYTILDGLRVQVLLFAALKTNLHVAFLPKDMNWKNDYIMARISSNPIAPLQLGLGANIHAARPANAGERVHRGAFTVSYAVTGKITVFSEYAATNLWHGDGPCIADNSWLLAGVTLPSARVLDLLKLEVEYKKDRIISEPDADLAWMLVLEKKALGLKFNFNAGSDPKALASTKLSDVGMHLRITADL